MSRRIPGVFVPSDAGLPAIAPATASGGAPATAGQSTKIPSHIGIAATLEARNEAVPEVRKHQGDLTASTSTDVSGRHEQL